MTICSLAFRLEPRHGPPPWYFPQSRPHGPHHADRNSQWIDVPCRWVFFLIYSRSETRLSVQFFTHQGSMHQVCAWARRRGRTGRTSTSRTQSAEASMSPRPRILRTTQTSSVMNKTSGVILTKSSFQGCSIVKYKYKI